MAKILVAICVVLVFWIQIVSALQCLFCTSKEVDSECRLGERKFKPKMAECSGPYAKCYALAFNDHNEPYVRGCTTEADFCQTKTGSQFCKVCGSKFCNFWVMSIPGLPDREVEVNTLPYRKRGRSRKTIRRQQVNNTIDE
ncbi:uncharacterized protein LOC115879344 [Sitophilus oryzae]|uniref:Uncharacterized protein LOC115879344 n=1 Tax=Sitophilus oryzae TaxID=7048 RepID=A0A6J2XMT4_SITOR|nr:uncharacterized protein LOC115879344 [Sitophilus oryzae]